MRGLRAAPVVSRCQNFTQGADRPLLRIFRRVAEHVGEDRRDELGGLLLGFTAQADDAFGAGEQVDDAALLVKRRQRAASAQAPVSLLTAGYMAPATRLLGRPQRVSSAHRRIGTRAERTSLREGRRSLCSRLSVKVCGYASDRVQVGPYGAETRTSSSQMSSRAAKLGASAPSRAPGPDDGPCLVVDRRDVHIGERLRRSGSSGYANQSSAQRDHEAQRQFRS